MSAPGQATDGQLADLEIQYQIAKAKHDAAIQEGRDLGKGGQTTTPEHVTELVETILSSKQKMIDILNQMVSVSTQDPSPNLEAKRTEFLERLHALQARYDELSGGNDDLETLRRISEREEEKFEGPFLVYSGLFILGCFALAGAMIMKGV
jgi:hypothetical protein